MPVRWKRANFLVMANQPDQGSILVRNPVRRREAERRAEELVNHTASAAWRLVREWESGFDKLWGHPDPGLVLESLGTAGGELFDLSSAIATVILQFTRTTDPAAYARIMAKIQSRPATTRHGDGRISLTNG